MRLSDADREQLYEKLKLHAAQGRLGYEELERRVAAIAQAQTTDEAAAVMSDLPPLSSTAPSRRARSHGEADSAQPGWVATSERFRDPRSGRVMRVWVDSDGGRHYVAE